MDATACRTKKITATARGRIRHAVRTAANTNDMAANLALQIDLHKENHVVRHVAENEHAVRVEAARRGLVYCKIHADVCITRPGYFWGHYVNQCPRCAEMHQQAPIPVAVNVDPQQQHPPPPSQTTTTPQPVTTPFHLRFQGKNIRFQNQACSKFMHVVSQGDNGTKVNLWHDVGPHIDGNWLIEPINGREGEYTVGIRLASKKLYLNLDCGNLKDKTKVHMWGETHKIASNQWILNYVTDDIVNIIPVNSTEKKNFINADRGSRDKDGGKIHLWCGSGDSKSNQWKLIVVD